MHVEVIWKYLLVLGSRLVGKLKQFLRKGGQMAATGQLLKIPLTDPTAFQPLAIAMSHH